MHSSSQTQETNVQDHLDELIAGDANRADLGTLGEGTSCPWDRLQYLLPRATPLLHPCPQLRLRASKLFCSVCRCSEGPVLSQPFPPASHPSTHTCFMSLQLFGSEPPPPPPHPPGWLEITIVHWSSPATTPLSVSLFKFQAGPLSYSMYVTRGMI